MSYVFETPEELGRRLKLGREEFCQRLLTSLIVDGPYPKWNSRSSPSPEGLEFLRAVYRLSFSEEWGATDPVFVDELELEGRDDAEQGGAPDYGILWDGHVWLIELKTERGSHRAEQVPTYFDLAAHHHPGCRVELTYLTGPMSHDFAPQRLGDRYAHLIWADIVPVISAVWGIPSESSRLAVVEGLLATIESLDQPASRWRETLGRPEPAGLSIEPIDQALALVDSTAADGDQRALDFAFDTLETLLETRAAIRDVLASTPIGSPRRRVMAWVWRPESLGQPLTPSGADTGYELRFSRYRTDRYG